MERVMSLEVGNAWDLRGKVGGGLYLKGIRRFCSSAPRMGNVLPRKWAIFSSLYQFRALWILPGLRLPILGLSARTEARKVGGGSLAPRANEGQADLG